MKTNAKNPIVRKSLNEKQNELLNKENKSIFDYVKLANVSDKIENKTASKVYKNVISSEYTKTILGTSKIPSFAEFVAKLPIKDSYSNWHGYLVLSKFNTKNETAKKVSRQNTATAKK
jgi:N-glycosylase/DNA lyase